jgi:hypothetical protein
VAGRRPRVGAAGRRTARIDPKQTLRRRSNAAATKGGQRYKCQLHEWHEPKESNDWRATRWAAPSPERGRRAIPPELDRGIIWQGDHPVPVGCDVSVWLLVDRLADLAVTEETHYGRSVHSEGRLTTGACAGLIHGQTSHGLGVATHDGAVAFQAIAATRSRCIYGAHRCPLLKPAVPARWGHFGAHRWGLENWNSGSLPTHVDRFPGSQIAGSLGPHPSHSPHDRPACRDAASQPRPDPTRDQGQKPRFSS